MIDHKKRLYTVDGQRVRWNEGGYGLSTETLTVADARRGETMIYCWVGPTPNGYANGSWFYVKDGKDARHDLPALTNTPPRPAVGARVVYQTEDHKWHGRTGTVLRNTIHGLYVLFDDDSTGGTGNEASAHRLHPLYPDEDPQMLNPNLPIVANSEAVIDRPATILGTMVTSDGRTLFIIKMDHQPQYHYWVDRYGKVIPKYEGDGSFIKGRFSNKRQPVTHTGRYSLRVNAEPNVVELDVVTVDGKVTDVVWNRP